MNFTLFWRLSVNWLLQHENAQSAMFVTLLGTVRTVS